MSVYMGESGADISVLTYMLPGSNMDVKACMLEANSGDSAKRQSARRATMSAWEMPWKRVSRHARRARWGVAQRRWWAWQRRALVELSNT
jgi:hypothetical protein